MDPWQRSHIPRGFGFRHWFQDASGGEGYGRGRDPQWVYMVDNASPASSGRIANSIGESTPWPTLTDQDGATLGPLRYAQPTLASFLAWVAAQEPENMARAFGDEGARLLRDRAWIVANNPDQDRGAGLTRFEWFRRGVYLSARAPWWQKAYLRFYTDNVLQDAIRTYQGLGWKSERGMALLARIRNSGGGLMSAAASAARQRRGSESAQVDAAAKNYADRKDLYRRRIEDLYRRHTMDALPALPDFARDLAIDGAPALRQDGQPADYVGASSGPLPWLTFCLVALAYLWK